MVNVVWLPRRTKKFYFNVYSFYVIHSMPYDYLTHHYLLLFVVCV